MMEFQSDFRISSRNKHAHRIINHEAVYLHKIITSRQYRKLDVFKNEQNKARYP